MPTPVLQFKRGNAEVTGIVPALLPGEPAIALNTFDFFIGIDTSVANNKFFGSHRYWERENGTNSLKLKLVSNNGSQSINLRAPTGLGATFTYTFPATGIGNSGKVLTTNGDGQLFWSESLNSLSINNFVVSGVGTFFNDVGFTTTTNNVLGNENTGAIQLDGGMGIAKNLTVKENFYVGGNSEFVGVITTTAVATTAVNFNLINSNATNVNFAGAATALVMSAATGITTVNNNLTVAGDIRVNGNDIQASDGSTNITLTSNALTAFAGDIKVTGNDIQASDGSTNITLASNVLTSFAGDIKVGGNDLQASDGNTNITLTSNTLTSFAGDIKVGGNDLQASDGNTNITLTSNTLTTFAGDIKVTGNDIQSSDGNTNITLDSNVLTAFAGDIKVGGNDIQASDGNTNITLTSNTLTTFAGDIKVTGNDIQSSTGAVAITLSGNDVTIADDLTIQGNLYVNGNTSQVNTTALTVEDRTIELGLIDGSITATTTWDLGVLFNYGDAGTARKSAMIWEHSDSRFKFAKVLDSDTNGTNANTPQLTITGASNFAPIEIASLWITDCAGTSQVISCAESERFLKNITIDAGNF